MAVGGFGSMRALSVRKTMSHKKQAGLLIKTATVLLSEKVAV